MRNKILVIHGAGRLSEMTSKFVGNKYDKIVSFVNPEYSSRLPQDHCLSVITSFPSEIVEGSADYISTIGYKNMEARKHAFCTLSANYFLDPVNIIHPRSFISPEADIGVGNIFFPGVVIEDGVKIGDNNIFWSNSCICHDSTLGSHNFFAASVTVGGFCSVEECCFLGFGSIINEDLKIAKRTFVASGTVLTKSQLIPGARICGVPARLM